MLGIEDALIYALVTLNMAFCVLMIVWNLYYYFRIIDHTERWTKIFYSFIGLMWLVRFALFYLNVYPFGLSQSNPILLIMITFTLLALALASIIRVLKLRGLHDIYIDIRRLLKR
jgi:hypothetical protein